MRLAGKRAIITGAGAGQGRHVAARFAAEGAEVLLLDVDETAAAAAVDEIAAAGGTATWSRCDVSSEDDWADVVDRFGRTSGVDVLYNNAAVFSELDGSVVEVTRDLWDRILSVNVTGVYLGCKHVIPLMRSRGGGSIINIASIRATLGASTPQDAYSTAKGAVLGLSVSLAAYLAPDGIRVNVISPGTILTDMAPVKDDAAAKQRLTRYPLGRFGTPEDVAGAAVFFASDESSWVTGVELPVDGGTSSFYV